jgi:hypothetical protein
MKPSGALLAAQRCDRIKKQIGAPPIFGGSIRCLDGISEVGPVYFRLKFATILWRSSSFG